ncbi:MAG: exodeoxyribonuclease V subunit alpha [Comamonas sp.]|jgi:exodeoxyribonuclease V alpha subunit|nr:exodeoxyribonuclease V subunit alpha [Comamonas sp.]
MRGRRRTDLQTLDLFAGHESGDEAVAVLSSADLLTALERLADAGLLRRLDSALAAFVAAQDAHAEPALLVATAVLAQMEGRGHSCLPLAALPANPNEILGWPKEAVPVQLSLWEQLPATLADWLKALRRSPVVRVVGHDASPPDQGQPLVLLDGPAPLLYLRRYWDYERSVAAQIAQRTAADDGALDESQVRHWLDRLFSQSPNQTASQPDWQKLACALALRGRLSVITGGPGTGKTYTAARLLALLFATAPDAAQLRVALAAPTGKAAARLKQSIDFSLLELKGAVGSDLDLEALVKRMGGARTLHSLLGARPDTRRFAHHAGNPLDVDVLIVDEASMIHLEMMAALLQALPPTARLILLGDKDQLASVEAGAVLGDLCRDAQQGNYAADTLAYAQRVAGQELPAQFVAADHALPLAQHTVMLRESRRFGGPIGQLAQAVNTGDAPGVMGLLRAQTQSGLNAELWAREGGDVEAVVRSAVQGRGTAASYAAYAQVLAQGMKAGFDSEEVHQQWVADVLQAFDRYRLLCAVREGAWGVSGLNRAVEAALHARGAIRKDGEWYAGRPVMVTRNDAQLGVFNGDIGMALPSFADPRRLRAYFMQGEKLHAVSTARLAHVETAFAMTVHKSQGSEFEHTALVLAAQGGSVLSRELVYTGITRARKAFSLWSEVPGLLVSAMGSPTQRSSGLLRFLENK